MSEHISTDSFFINSIVGEGTRFDGNISLEGILRIDGDFSGDIKTVGKVLIGKNGRASCAIEAGTVVVGGAFKGDIVASDRVVVLSTSILIGNITAPKIVIEDGVVFHGSCMVGRKIQHYSDAHQEPDASVLSSERKDNPINKYNPALKTGEKQSVKKNGTPGSKKGFLSKEIIASWNG